MQMRCEEVNCIELCLSVIQLWDSALAVLNVGKYWYTRSLSF
jgi:hypothetical protein